MVALIIFCDMDVSDSMTRTGGVWFGAGGW